MYSLFLFFSDYIVHVQHALKIQGQLFSVCVDPTCVQCKYLHLRLGWQKWMIWEGGRGNVYVNEQPALYKFIWCMNWFMPNNDASLCHNIQERKTQNVVFSLTADLTSTVCPSIWRDRGVIGARWRQGGSWTAALQTPNYRSDGKNSCSVLLSASMLLVHVFQLHITYVYCPDISALVDRA